MNCLAGELSRFLPGDKIPCLRYLVPEDKISQGGGTFYPGVKCPRGQDTMWYLVPGDKIPWGQDKPVQQHIEISNKTRRLGSDQNISTENCFHVPPIFPERCKAAPTSRVFSRRHSATVTLQCKTELDVHSVSLVMHFLIFFSKFR